MRKSKFYLYSINVIPVNDTQKTATDRDISLRITLTTFNYLSLHVYYR